MRNCLKLYFLAILIILYHLPLFAYEDTQEKRFNLWPIVVYSKNKVKSYERLEALGPFLYRYKFEEETGTSIRPIYSSVESPEEKRAYFLSPLGLYKSDNETTTLKFIPLVNKKIEKTPKEGEEGSKWEYFPIFWGKTAQNETYGGLFPIYGKYKDRFGREEITFFLWPLYSKVTYEEYTAQNILWPFIRIAKPKDPENKNFGGFKVWPFYGHFKEGEEERKFVLWPFYLRTSYKDELGNFENKLWVFPFYGKEETDTYERTVYLWPFYQRICATDPFYEQIDAPWPFYRHIKGEKREGKRYWPLYGYLKKEDSFDSFILWPFYFYKEDNFYRNNMTYLEREHRFLLLSKENQIYENNTLSRRELRLWPLYYSYEDHKAQLKSQYFPALLPIFDEGMERNYGALLKLLENFEKGDYRLVKLLWGLYRFEKMGSREVQELAFLLRRVKDEGTNYIEFFEGLIGFGKIETHPVLKIFYINILPYSEVEKRQNVSQDSGLSGNL